ncbi:hypothetical protein ACFU8I_24720 [Streptomyces sp. NPDC057540]|uniref:hypothetical protein n=1 Tax=Streptomyces sp. NPDC057540 TaxID=3346160 RepID=UPI003674A73A
MPEQIQYTQPPEPGSLDVGAALGTVCDVVEEAAEVEAVRDTSAALAIPRTHGAVAIATMTDRLLTRADGLAVGVAYIPVDRRSMRGARALARWETLKVKGPSDDPLGTWSYMRDLAHIVRDMVLALREHRATAATSTRAFVGRPSMPPLAPDTP